MRTRTRLAKKMGEAFCRHSAGAIAPAYGVDLHAQLLRGYVHVICWIFSVECVESPKKIRAAENLRDVSKRSQKRVQI